MSGPDCLVCGAPRVIGVPHRGYHWEHLCLHCWMWAAAASLMPGGPTWGEQRECPNLAQKGHLTAQEYNSYLWSVHDKNRSRAINDGKFGANFTFSPELVDPKDLEEP